MIALLTPSEGECADLQTAQQRAFLAMEKRPYDVDKIDWSTPTWTQAPDGTKPAPVVFSWSGTGAVPARFALSEFADFRQKYTMNTTEQTLAVYNLLPGKRYYWRINDSPIGSFTTGAALPRFLYVQGLANVRDIGGYRTVDGRRLRYNRILRGSEMDGGHWLAPMGQQYLHDFMHSRTDIDLRKKNDQAKISPIGTDVRSLPLEYGAYDAIFAAEYYAMTQALFTLFADPLAYPIYMHCIAGADRTGTVIFLLECLLGMREEDIVADYEASSLSIWGDRSHRSEEYRAMVARLATFSGADRREQVKTYLKYCGITQAQFTAIENNLLEH